MHPHIFPWWKCYRGWLRSGWKCSLSEWLHSQHRPSIMSICFDKGWQIMLGLHWVLVTIHGRVETSIEQEANRMVTLNTNSWCSSTYLFLCFTLTLSLHWYILWVVKWFDFITLAKAAHHMLNVRLTLNSPSSNDLQPSLIFSKRMSTSISSQLQRGYEDWLTLGKLMYVVLPILDTFAGIGTSELIQFMCPSSHWIVLTKRVHKPINNCDTICLNQSSLSYWVMG